MSIQALPKMGTPSLNQPSLPVTEFATNALYTLIENMHDTMIAAQGIGLAAPQIGVNLQVIILGFDQNERYPHMQSVPFMVLINPKLDILDHTQITMWEGCLSVPGLRGKVPRYKKLRYKGFDPDGRLIEGIAEGFHARILQHECDHLMGVLYPSRIENLNDFGFEEVVLERATTENALLVNFKGASLCFQN